MSEKQILSDEELAKLLALVPKPEPKAGFEQRMMARLATAPAGNVIPFPARAVTGAPTKARTSPWPMAAALAASLLLGVWMSGGSIVTDLLDGGVETASSDLNMSDLNIDAALSGIDQMTDEDQGGKT